jgi:Zn ribbon nucleic-acid-binding protein
MRNDAQAYRSKQKLTGFAADVETTDAATALRLELPCPYCSHRGTLAAHRCDSQCVVLCIGCGHAWAERSKLHRVLAAVDAAGNFSHDEGSQRLPAHGSHELDYALISISPN